MDERLRLTRAASESSAPLAPELPLITVVWRALRSDCQKRSAEERRTGDALARIAEETFRLQRLAARETSGADKSLAAIAARLEAALRELNVTMWSPQGEPFTNEMADLFENVAQLPDPNIAEPRVAEVIAPALSYRDTLLKMGKVVIAVPVAE